MKEKFYIVNVDFGNIEGDVEIYAYSEEEAKKTVANMIEEYLEEELQMNIHYFNTEKFVATCEDYYDEY